MQPVGVQPLFGFPKQGPQGTLAKGRRIAQQMLAAIRYGTPAR